MPAGRPSKLTPEIQALIVRYLSTGCYLETAAGAAGINKATLHRWLNRGETAKSGRYRQFCDAVTRALDHAEVRAVGHVAAASPGDWRAAAWFLEHGRQQRWYRKQEVKVDASKDLADSTGALLSGIYGIEDHAADDESDPG